MADRIDELRPDELLYRRMSTKADPRWYNPASPAVVHRNAFQPTKNDTDGLSLLRAAYRSLEEAAHNPRRPGGEYYIAVVQAGDLVKLGIDIRIEPDCIDQYKGGPPAHVVLSNLNAANRRASETIDLASQIASRLIRSVYGPFRDDKDWPWMKGPHAIAP